MGKWKRYSDEELALARKIVDGVDFSEHGALIKAAEEAYLRKDFPGRSLSGTNALLGRVKEQVKLERKAQEEKEEKTFDEEQVTFYCTATISEKVLREKHDAEKALLLLKRSIIDDAHGVRYDELKFSLKSIERAAKYIWPDEYAARLSELYGEEDY